MNILNLSINNYNQYNNVNFTAKKPCIYGEELRNLLKTHTTKEIADLKGVTENYIKKIVKFYEVDTPYLDKKNELKMTIADRLMSGETINSISREEELSVHVVKYIALKVLGKEKYNEIRLQNKINRVNEHMPINIDKQNKVKEVIEVILKNMRDGMTFFAAARDAGVNPSTISRYIDKNVLNEIRSYINNKKREAIRNLVKQGYTIKKIAQELHSTPQKIYYIMGTAYRSEWKNERKEYQIKNILDYKQKGMTNEEIAEEMGISIDTVRRLLKYNKRNNKK